MALSFALGASSPLVRSLGGVVPIRPWWYSRGLPGSYLRQCGYTYDYVMCDNGRGELNSGGVDDVTTRVV